MGVRFGNIISLYKKVIITISGLWNKNTIVHGRNNEQSFDSRTPTLWVPILYIRLDCNTMFIAVGLI